MRPRVGYLQMFAIFVMVAAVSFIANAQDGRGGARGGGRGGRGGEQGPPPPKDVVARYTTLTGRMPLPPLWALGNQQSRWSYFPDSRVRFIADNFRQRRIPADVLWLDVHYLDGYKPFTWDRERVRLHRRQSLQDDGRDDVGIGSNDECWAGTGPPDHNVKDWMTQQWRRLNE